MAELVNLNKARKARARQTAKADAAANRAQFGRTKADKTRTAAEAKQAARNLDGAKREP